jgi:outer membrane protein TolC
MKKLVSFMLLCISLNAGAQSIINDISNPGFSLQDPVAEKLAELGAKNFMIQSAGKSVEMAQEDVKKAKSMWFNHVSPNFNLNEFTIARTLGMNNQLNSFWPRYNINLSLPLGMFAGNKSAVNKSKIAVEQAKLNQETIILNIKRNIRVYYQDYISNKYLLALQESLLQDEKILLDRVNTMFENNQVDLEIFTAATKKYNDLLAKKINLLKEINYAIYNLEEILGMPLDIAISQVAVVKPQ